MKIFNRVVGGSLVAADGEKRDLWTWRLQGQNYEFSVRLKHCFRLDTLGRPRASICTMFRSVIILDWKEEKRFWGNMAISIIIIRKRRQHLRELKTDLFWWVTSYREQDLQMVWKAHYLTYFSEIWFLIHCAAFALTVCRSPQQARHQLFVETLLWCERSEHFPDMHTWAWTDRMDLYVQFNPDVKHSFSNRMTPVRVWT